MFGGTAPVEQISGSTPTFLVANPTGVQGVYSASGSVDEMAIYSVYGKQTISTGSKMTPFGFQGSYGDSTGLIYLINRYYDPSTDQFMSIDPAVAQTNQPYVFTNDNSLNATDPLGLKVSLSYLSVTTEKSQTVVFGDVRVTTTVSATLYGPGGNSTVQFEGKGKATLSAGRASVNVSMSSGSFQSTVSGGITVYTSSQVYKVGKDTAEVIVTISVSSLPSSGGGVVGDVTSFLNHGVKFVIVVGRFCVADPAICFAPAGA
jgi:RHS repeat-associated protein